MSDLFAPEWSGEPFRLFSWQHLTRLSVVFVAAVGCVLVGRCLGSLHLYALFVFVVNGFVGSNYLYVNGKPEFATVLDVLPPWPRYLFVLEVIVVCIMLLAWLGGRRWRDEESATTWVGQPVS